MDLIVLLKVRRRGGKSPLPARRCFQHPAITLCKSWPGMLIHRYLKCIEFPWKMIHSCHPKLINNNDESGWRLEYLHAYLASPCMQEHSPVSHALHLWQHIWIKDGFEFKRAGKMSYFCNRNWFFFLHMMLNLYALTPSLVRQCRNVQTSMHPPFFVVLNFTLTLKMLQCVGRVKGQLSQITEEMLSHLHFCFYVSRLCDLSLKSVCPNPSALIEPWTCCAHSSNAFKNPSSWAQK